MYRSWPTAFTLVGICLFVLAIPAAGADFVSGYRHDRLAHFVQASTSPIATFVDDRAECSIDPRPLEDFVALAGTPGVVISELLGTPVSTPPPPTGGAAANSEVHRAITNTIVEHVACMRVGDWQRIAALMTDRYFAAVFGGVNPQNFAQITGIPIPQPSGHISVADPRALDDGRVSAIVTIDHAPVLMIFARQDDRFLIDYMYILTDQATPTPIP